MNCKKCTARLGPDDHEQTKKGTVITCPNCGFTRLIPTYPDRDEPSTLARIVTKQIHEDHKSKRMGE